MNHVNLLDCTLRDGGYVNDWRFGAEHIRSIIDHLERSGVNILELGFMRDEPFCPDRTIFPSVETINELICKDKGIIYSAMIEAFHPFPLEKLSSWNANGVDLIRVCIWKRCIDDHMKYCREIKEKGYQITIQPSRVEQYNDEEFIDMLKRSNELEPYAVYVVDTWGTQSPASICHYVRLADQYLLPEVKVGYHGHNNKLQALACVDAIMKLNLNRDVCLDSSVMGMGRGAGNLNTEIIMDYLNSSYGKTYKIQEIMSAYYQSLEKIYRQMPWGYSMYYYLSALFGANPNFAKHFEEHGYSAFELQEFLQSLTEKEKIVYDSTFIETRRRRLKCNR